MVSVCARAEKELRGGDATSGAGWCVPCGVARCIAWCLTWCIGAWCIAWCIGAWCFGCGAMAHGPVRASHACGEMRGSKLAQSKWSDASRLLPVSLRQQFRLPSSATLTYIESSKRT